MVGRGAGAARPVLLACRQGDPHRLARTRPSCGAPARCLAPLLPWRVQCPVGVCAALTAGQGGGAGAASLVRPPPLALPAVRVAGCPFRVPLVLACWCAIPSGTCVPGARSSGPFGARRVSVVWLCARAPVVPPPPVFLRAHFARCPRKVRVGPFQVVCAPPGFLPGSLAPLALCVVRGVAWFPCLPAKLSVCPHGVGCMWPVQLCVRGGWEGGCGRWGFWLGFGRPVLVRWGVLGQAAVLLLRALGNFLLPATRGEGCRGRGVGGHVDAPVSGVVLCRVACEGLAQPSQWFPCKGTKAGFHCVSLAIEGVASILFWSVSVCFQAVPGLC